MFGLNKKDVFQIGRIYRLNLQSRYMSSRAGLAWAVFNPLLQMFTYLVVFGFILRQRVPGSDNPMDYVIWFICGFAPWMAFSEGVHSTALSVVVNVRLMKSFPIKSELFPIAASMLGLPQLLVGVTLVVVLCFATGAGIGLSILWLPLFIPLMLAFIAGMGFFLSAVTVFIRDLTQVIGTVLMFLMYFSPVFFDVSQLPILPKLSFFNPVHQLVVPLRSILIEQAAPDLWGLGYLAALTLLLWVFGLWFFRRYKGLFESAL